MTYLDAASHTDTPAGQRFRALLERPGILRLPGAHNGMAALQAKAAGFEALYLSGAAMTAYCIDLIDENNARRIFLSLLKHIAHTASADAYEHFHKV